MSKKFIDIVKNLNEFMVRYNRLRRSLTTNGFTRQAFIALGIIFFLSITNLHPATYGSNSAVTRPARVFFPTGATDNRLEGFASFDSGFFLEDYTTTCSYNSFFPITAHIGLTGGLLTLQQDLVLSNTNLFLTAGGYIDGSLHTLEFNKTIQNPTIPTLPNPIGTFSIKQLSQSALTAQINAIDWNYNGQYLIAGTQNNGTAANELQLYYFDGATLTATTMESTGNIAKNINSVRWFSNDNYVAVASATGTGNEVNIYYKRANGSFALRSGLDLSPRTVQAVAWHPSGWFFVEGQNNSRLVSYNFNPTTGQVGAAITTLTIVAAPSNNAISFAPGGNYLALGTSRLDVISVTGAGVIATSANITPGLTVRAVDWCPTGTYVAAGLAAGADTIRIYAHTLPSALAEVTSARVGATQQVNDVHWDPTGNLLMVALSTGTGYELRIFYFDKVKLQLVEYYRSSLITISQFAARWSRDGNFIARGDATTPFNVTVHGITRPPLTIKDLSIVFNNDANLAMPLVMKGSCKINGRGKRLTLQSGAELQVRPGGALVLEDITLQGLGNNLLRCLTDAGSITFRNCNLNLAYDYTFSRGSLLFDKSVMITGTNSFIYTSGLTSTIASMATLYVAPGAGLQYNPVLPRQNLLYMTDATSQLYLDGCTLYSTRTGLRLSNGTLTLDDQVTLSSGALYLAEGMSLQSSLKVNARAGANVLMYGIIRAD